MSRPIEFTDYEINDLARTLKYAKDQKIKELKEAEAPKERMQLEVGAINALIARLPLKEDARKAIFGDK